MDTSGRLATSGKYLMDAFSVPGTLPRVQYVRQDAGIQCLIPWVQISTLPLPNRTAVGKPPRLYFDFIFKMLRIISLRHGVL